MINTMMINKNLFNNSNNKQVIMNLARLISDNKIKNAKKIEIQAYEF